jgi:hypothetical protein
MPGPKCIFRTGILQQGTLWTPFSMSKAGEVDALLQRFDRARKKHDSRHTRSIGANNLPPAGFASMCRASSVRCATAIALISRFGDARMCAPDCAADLQAVDFHAIRRGGTALRNNCSFVWPARLRNRCRATRPRVGHHQHIPSTLGSRPQKRATGPDDVFFARISRRAEREQARRVGGPLFSLDDARHCLRRKASARSP